VRIVGGSWRGRRLVAPSGDRIRPTSDRVREAWMSAMGGRFDGERILDLFAGTGALGLECLSRGAAQVTFVDASPESLELLRSNLDALDVDPARVRVVRADVLEWLDAGSSEADESRPALALADPPYEGGWAEALVERYTASPFADTLWVEHPSTLRLHSPRIRRTRRYGGTTLTTLTPDP
jgi:16S rRNA (guanine966-N2)-methyltransferase